MNFLIDFLIGSLITISGEQVISPAQKSLAVPASGIAASAPSPTIAASAIPIDREFIPTVSQMKDKV